MSTSICTKKIFWGADRKIPRSVMGNCNFPVSDQLLVLFGQILPVLDKNVSKLDQRVVRNRKIAFFHFGPRHFPVGAPKIFLSVCIFQKSYAYFCGILTKFQNRGTLRKQNFFGTIFCQENGKNSAAAKKNSFFFKSTKTGFTVLKIYLCNQNFSLKMH